MKTIKARSPSYPSLLLEGAIEKTKKIHLAYNKSHVAREAIAKCIGYSSLSGSALTALGSLTSYGLLERRGKGEAAVSELALKILFAESSEERADATREALLTPSCFAKINEKFGDHVPETDGIVAFLCRNSFTQNAGQNAAKAYVGSLQFVKSQGESDRSDVAVATIDNVEVESTFEATPVMNQSIATSGEFRELVRGTVGDGNAFRLMGKSEFTPDQWQVVMDMLDIQVKTAKRQQVLVLTKDSDTLVSSQ